MRSLLLAILIVSLACASCVKIDYADVLVTAVIDGDTLEIFGGERVRLIGIDCPEMYESDKLHRDAKRSGQDIETIMAMGRNSYKFTKKLAEGKKVALEFDLERRDKYGRLLAYAFIPLSKDGSMETLFLNAEIIKQGYAQPLSIPPNLKYADLFQKLYQQARENRRGLYDK